MGSPKASEGGDEKRHMACGVLVIAVGDTFAAAGGTFDLEVAFESPGSLDRLRPESRHPP